MGILTNLSLFSGAGGLDLGARIVGGIRTVCYVEYDPYAQGVLMSRIRDGGLDEAPIWDDVRTFDGAAWRGKVDIVSGGFPCQPHSGAHKGERERDNRNLWPDYLRIVRECRPAFVLGENVRGIVSNGYAVEVMADLEEIGYCVTPISISACEVGAPHARERVFFISHLSSLRFNGMDENKKILSPGFHLEDTSRWVNKPFDIPISVVEIESDPIPGICRVDDGLAEAMDGIRLCGNGVVPQQSVPAWKAIKEMARNTMCPLDRGED